MDSHQHSSPAPGFLPAHIGNGSIAMSSREIAELCEKQHQHVRRDIEAMCQGLDIDPSTFGRIYRDARNRDQREYLLPKDLTLTLVAGYNIKLRKRIIDRWMELEASQGLRLPTTAEAFASVFSMVADQERRQAVQDQAIKAIGAKVDLIGETQLLKVKPQNAENITEIRKRIAKQFGLPVRVINEVMAQMPYSPKPAGMVKNANEKAEGSSFAVYWIRDVTTVFKRFVGDCHQVSPSKWTHPDIGKFTRVKPAA